MSNLPILTKNQLAQAMQLPGFKNWRPRADVPELNRPLARPSELPGSGRIAAVMILVYTSPPSGNTSVIEIKTVLTKRHANLSKHASQISFPGGRLDPGESLEQTAIRETNEEIGIPVNQMEILGQLNPVYIPPSDFTVTPFVGWHVGVPSFVRSEFEVERIINVSIQHLLDPSTLVFGEIRRPSGDVLNVPYYQIDQHRVWGATAIMIGEFIERVSLVIR